MIKISKTSKLDGIYSWSLQARETCPGSHGDNGELVDACKGCYATTGNYRFKSVKAPRIHNREDWKRDGWVDDMVQALDNQRYFRWFDSGDVYCLGLAEKIYQVMQRTPWVKHWLPTRSYKFPKIQIVLERMRELGNVSVRYSSDSVNGVYSGMHGSVIFDPEHQYPPQGTFECKAYQNDGKCNGCRACYDKDIPVIAYPGHGRNMSKVQKIIWLAKR